ncbi:Sjogren's syndrome/scleroderma autoantigen 1 family protein [Halorubrum trueperi]|uniref:Sjogren's syndrome/scleroderma autoantigen 1 family protein n=1 Tax=Halorubrum trueperi TaxID=2004704 RepID=A0ABD5UHI0_9EURY
MSDGFDKEAEREKLREKFAEDEQKREHTQRMSELLLKGATMTNRHCDDCGDPIFRQDGQEFCPTCHTVDAKDAADTTGAADESATRETTTDSETATPTTGSSNAGQETTPTGNAPTPTGNAPTPTENAPTPTGNASTPTATGSQSAGAESTEPIGSSRGGDGSDAAAGPTVAADSGTGGVADARASLTRTLTRFAHAAEETDDPRRAREHLRAAREAAEALAALD